MVERRIGVQQAGGVQHQVLHGITTYKFGQQGTNTVEPAMDALEQFLQTDLGMVTVGLPNGLGDPSSILNNLGTAHKRFVVFTAPLVPYAGATGSPGSMDRLVNSTQYDAAHHLSAQKIVEAGFTTDNACRFGHEYNTEVGKVGNYPWSTGFIDPYTGSPVTISTFMKAAEKVENIYRSEGWIGYAGWSLGTSDTSALPPEQAMPTHGDPAKTVLDYDCYVGTKYGTTKNDYASGFALSKNAWDKYAAYCSAHGLLMASSEFNATMKVPSPYFLNDAAGAQFYYDIYALWKSYAYLMAWCSLYQVNQFPTGQSYIDEEHDLFLSVSTAGGAPSGVAATAEYTAPYPPGKSDIISGNGTNSLAQSGSLDNSSSSGLHYIWTPSPNRQHSLDAYRKTFGGFGTTGGAAGLQNFITPPVVPPTHTVIPSGRKVRRQSVKYR